MLGAAPNFQSPDDKIDADKVNYLYILFDESMVSDAQKTERNLMNKHRLYRIHTIFASMEPQRRNWKS